MFLDAGRDSENIRIKNDVRRPKTDDLGEYLVAALADSNLAFDVVRLPLFVEGHHDHGGTVIANKLRLSDECFLAFFQADGVDDGLALYAAQARLDDRPLGRIDHDGNARHSGFRGNQVQKFCHRLFRIQHAFVHVDIDNLSAVLNLLARDLNRCVVIIGLDQAPENRRARDVASLTDVDEQIVRTDRYGFEA